ncbi:TrkA-C domain protein [hydrothermal vent metagenome]|uniref:TrkA-C domain protein n=1 Tax=hydrothermal vent metagenome TaxID=652676 RepID=A0A3B1ALA1_9ZZZZ
MELNLHASVTLLLTVLALILFSQDKVRLESSSLFILTLLVLFFTLIPFYNENNVQLVAADFFIGFGHEALVAISALMILGKGIETTGALKPLTKILSQSWSKSPALTFLATLLVSAVLSAFVNNTPIVIMLIPILISVAINNQTSPSKLLIPMGLTTIIGGMATTIGTSTNLLVVALANDLAGIQFSMFEFSLPVIIVGGVGILLLWGVAPYFLPERKIALNDQQQRVYNAVLFLSDKSLSTDMEVRDVLEKTDHEMPIHKIVRGEYQQIMPIPTVKLKSDDKLFISGTAEKLKEFEAKLNGTLHNINTEGELLDGEYKTQDDDQVLAEILVTGGSILHNRSIKQARIAERFNVLVLAIHRLHRSSQRITKKLSKMKLHRGDILLVQVSRENLHLIKEDTKLLVLDNVTDYISNGMGNRAILIMLGVVGLAATGVLPIAVSALVGVVAMLLSGCLGWRDIGKALSAQVILVIVVSLALGRALTDTGGTDFLANSFISVTHGMSTVMILSSLLFLMAIITNVVSNTTSAIIGTPVAITIAQHLGVPLEPFILAVLFGANMSYATPIGYQTNLLIYSAGGYKFTDFLRFGVPFTVVVGFGFSVVLSILYGL